MHQQQIDELPAEPMSMRQVVEVFGHQTTGKPTVTNDDISAHLREIKELDAEMKIMEQRKQFLKDKIGSYMLTSDALITADGSIIATWKCISSNKFDLKSFRVEQPELTEQYMQVRESRQFLVK